MTTEKDPLKKKEEAENPFPKQDKKSDQTSLKVPNPFEKGHGELPQETLDSIEQFKEAQTERD